jgi:hypothetical protein
MSDIKARLNINNKIIGMNEFVESMVAHVTLGAVNSLKGVDDVRAINVTMDKGEIDMLVNGEDVPLTPFANDIVAATLLGLVSLLKGADDVESMVIQVDAG